MYLTFQGTNTLLLTKGASSLFIDPHFSRPGLFQLLWKIKPDKAKIRSGLKKLNVSTLDGILLTHTHYDHAMDAVEVAHQTGGVIYGSKSAVNLAKGAGLSQDKFRVVTPMERINIEAFPVTWLDACHISFPPPLGWLMPDKGRINQPLTPPLHFWRYQSGSIYAILIDNLLVLGSAGLMRNAYPKVDVKTVALSVGGLETKPLRYLERLYRQAVLQTGAQQVMLSHWDNFFRPISRDVQTLGLGKITIQRIKRLGKLHGQEVKVLVPGVRNEI
jgi:L-ascorbate metabolism protein UlaG (beta-lactamase superfamily)